MKYLKHLMQIQKDHLKDTQMLVDYAEEEKRCENSEGVSIFENEAKARLKKYEDLKLTIKRILQDYPHAEEHTQESIICHFMHEDNEAWVQKLKSKIAEL